MEDAFVGTLGLSRYIKIQKRKHNFPLLPQKNKSPILLMERGNWKKKKMREINTKDPKEMELSCSL